MPREEPEKPRSKAEREDPCDPDHRTQEGKDQVQEASEESFPASDPPSSNPGHA